MNKLSEDKGIKTAKEYRHPIDNIFYSIIKIISPKLNSITSSSIIPNIITFTSLIFSLISLYLFYKNKYLLLSSSLLIFGYFLDCWDGYYARKYNMVSKFGDYFDHISDLSKFILFIFILYNKKKNNKYFFKYITLIIIICISSIIQLGCEEKLYNSSSESYTLQFTKLFCRDNNIIKFTKYFGTASLFLLLAVIINIY